MIGTRDKTDTPWGPRGPHYPEKPTPGGLKTDPHAGRWLYDGGTKGTVGPHSPGPEPF